MLIITHGSACTCVGEGCTRARGCTPPLCRRTFVSAVGGFTALCRGRALACRRPGGTQASRRWPGPNCGAARQSGSELRRSQRRHRRGRSARGEKIILLFLLISISHLSFLVPRLVAREQSCSVYKTGNILEAQRGKKGEIPFKHLGKNSI